MRFLILLVLTMTCLWPHRSVRAEPPCVRDQLWYLLGDAEEGVTPEHLAVLTRSLPPGYDPRLIESITAYLRNSSQGISIDDWAPVLNGLERAHGLKLNLTLDGWRRAARESPKDFENALYLAEIYSNGLDRVSNAALRKTAQKQWKRSLNPKGLAWNLHDPFKPESRQLILRDLLEFARLNDKRRSVAEAARAANHWVRSPEHANYLYAHLDDLGDRKNAMLEYLLLKSPHFAGAKQARSARPSLVTYAFEKETSSPNVRKFFTAASPIDFDHLDRVGVDPSAIGATAEMPRYIGGFDRDMKQVELKTRVLEVDLNRLHRQMRDLGERLKERDAFHIHHVVELPVDYPYMEKLGLWWKQMNDYLTLSGMEEGLHPKGLTKFLKEKYLPRSWEEVDLFKHKMLSAGLRTQIYGDAFLDDHLRVGIELRDISRTWEGWERSSKKVSASLAERRWEAPTGAHRGYHLNLDELPDSKVLEELIQAGIEPTIAREMLDANNHLKLGLVRYENHEYFDYRTGQLLKPTAEQKTRIQEARKAFLTELKSDSQNILETMAKGEEVPPEDIDLVMKWSLANWAKKARASELFQNW